MISARYLPRHKGSGPGVRVPGPSGAPREYLLCSLSGTDICLDWGGSSDFGLSPLPQALSAPWLLDGGGSVREISLELTGRERHWPRREDHWDLVLCPPAVGCSVDLGRVWLPTNFTSVHVRPSSLSMLPWGRWPPLSNRLQVSGGHTARDHNTPGSCRADAWRRQWAH